MFFVASSFKDFELAHILIPQNTHTLPKKQKDDF